MSVEQSTIQAADRSVHTLLKPMGWEELKAAIKDNPMRFKTYDRVVVLDVQDEWFDPVSGYPLNVIQWYERQIAERNFGDSLTIYSQYVLKIERPRDPSSFSLSYRPVSIQVWLSSDPERFMSYAMFPGGYVGLGNNFEFVIKNPQGNVVERFAVIPDQLDENGYCKWYRQMKEVTKTLKFDPPTK